MSIAGEGTGDSEGELGMKVVIVVVEVFGGAG